MPAPIDWSSSLGGPRDLRSSRMRWYLAQQGPALMCQQMDALVGRCSEKQGTAKQAGGRQAGRQASLLPSLTAVRVATYFSLARAWQSAMRRLSGRKGSSLHGAEGTACGSVLQLGWICVMALHSAASSPCVHAMWRWHGVRIRPVEQLEYPDV
jgi:hypothetical protein